MRRPLAAVLLALLVASPVAAASAPPPGLAGTLAITASTATSVTLHAEQTGGSTVSLLVEHYCYAGEVYAGMQKVRFSGSTDVTVDIGPRAYHGQTITPDDCWAFLTFEFSSRRAIVLVVVDTL